ncbi:hypothetical protein ACMZ5D_10180, partial [Acinetobacter baumannii]
MNKIPCSVYIVTLNCGAWLERTLQSVSAVSYTHLRAHE